MDVKDEVAFFQAVKARLVKFDSTGSGRTDEELETAIRQVIDQALVSDQVIDIYDAAGLKKPDISILSEKFLLEVQSMEHKNIALEVLKKLLSDEIKSRAKKNLVHSKKLEEMLEAALQRYHNKAITSAQVIDELINLGKDIRDSDSEAAEMGLTDFEYAFYTAVANNDSARELMQQEMLRELAVVLTERVRANTSIDWTIKESVRSKLKVIVKRTLRQYGYPPDMQKLATDTVLKQAELITDEPPIANYSLRCYTAGKRKGCPCPTPRKSSFTARRPTRNPSPIGSKACVTPLPGDVFSSGCCVWSRAIMAMQNRWAVG